MKLDIASLYFNGDTKTRGNTASWGTALGQERPDYPISIDGGQELVDLINLNHIDFNPKHNSNHKANIKQLIEKKIISSGCFNKVYVNNVEIEGPFFLLVIEETSGSHIGRKSLKYNNKIEIDGSTNEKFYQKIQDLVGSESCWFAYDISSLDNKLHMSVIKVDDKNVEYQDAKSRKDHWESFINDYIDVKQLFKTYLLEVHKIKHQSSANEYLKSMPKIMQWFIQNGLCKKDYQIWNIRNDNSKINHRLKTDYKIIWDKLNKIERGWYGTPWNRWLEFIDWYFLQKRNDGIKNEISIEFKNITNHVNLYFTEIISQRFISSLITKPFVIFTGLSGSGKTKLAQSFAVWISESKEQYAIIPVGADWTNREPLLGYPNSLIKNHYVKPESGVLDILIRAHKEYTNNKNDLIKCKPYFLILDEMNLSHVERYFADFLSAMESGDMINLYSDGERYSKFNDNNEPIIDSLIPENISLPKNLFIIGTVNIDETTYMFSPKVLDRANTIEFRVTADEMLKYLKESKAVDMNLLLEDANSHKGKGSVYSNEFMNLAARNGISVDYNKHSKTFLDFFTRLKLVGAEFGYRTANEMVVLVTYLEYFGLHLNEAYDIAIMQKLLPKINGSRSKLVKALPELAALCIKSNDPKNVENIFKSFIDNGQSLDEFKSEISFPLSFEKLCRMYKNAHENGFASYAEA